MGIQNAALMLLGIGILSERFGGGKGLISLGTGIQTLAAAPLTGTGTGLTSFAGGLRDLAESFGDIGRGIGEIFKYLPKLGNGYKPGLPGAWNGNGVPPPPPVFPPINGGGAGARALLPLTQASGDGAASLYTGGGANVPQPPILPSLPPPSILYGGQPAWRIFEPLWSDNGESNTGGGVNL